MSTRPTPPPDRRPAAGGFPLIEVLVDFPPTPTSLSVLYPSNRQLSPRVRTFVDWLVETVKPRLEQDDVSGRA